MNAFWKIIVVIVAFLMLGTTWAFAHRPTVTYAFQPIYYDNPVQGSFEYVQRAGSVVVNGYAYSYAVLDTSRLHVGDQFDFLPSVNSPIVPSGTTLSVTITFDGLNYTQTTRGFWITIYVPLNQATIRMGGYGDPRVIHLWAGDINSQRIYAQPVWIDSNTVKLYAYIGPYGMPRAPLS
ncbi:MAG TPA: hypothetical protein VKA28_02680 [Candidatus Bathyarchaeia archaeon]|nr:hypothetical protein [Candidatus Bathyarchaeia archaeon]